MKLIGVQRAGLAGASGNWVRRLFPCQSEQLKVGRHLDFPRDDHYSDGFNIGSYRAEFQTLFEAVHCIAIATIIMKK